MGDSNFDGVNVGGQPVATRAYVDAVARGLGNTVSVLKNTAAPVQVLAAQTYARVVDIEIKIDETFADGTGTKPSFAIGETTTPNKFTAALNSGTAGDKVGFSGTLSANKALIITPTPAVGDGTGGFTATAISAPTA